MPPTLQEVLAQARLLSLDDKAALANELLEGIQVLDPRIEAIWDKEVQGRIEAHEKDPLPTFTYEEITAKYRRP